MSTREIAYKIVSKLNEKQLKDFIIAFGQYYNDTIDVKSTNTEINERLNIFNELEQMIREVPDLDYDEALEEYREEKYGI